MENGKEIIYGGAKRPWLKTPIVCAKIIVARDHTARTLMYLSQFLLAWLFIIFEVDGFITR